MIQRGSTQSPDSIIRTTSPVTVRCRYKGKNGAPCDSRDTLKRCYKKRLRTEAGRYFVCSEPTRRGGVWGARHDRRCASLLLGYVGVGGCTARSVCATKSRHRARSSMCEFAAGLREVGGCTARSVCATKSGTHRRCASLLLGYVGVGGCTARSVCATESGTHRRCASLLLGYVGVGGCAARSVCATESGTIVDVRVCCWAMWEWVAAQPGVSVPQSQDVEA